MKHIIYPAIFEREDGGYVVNFPDLKGCFADGETIVDAYKCAKEVLSMHLSSMKNAPPPSPIEFIQLEQGQRIMFVEADKHSDIKYIKKSDIPRFIDSALEAKGYTKYQLAKILSVDRSYITRIANGERLPSPEMAQRIATLLEFDWRIFFTYAPQ